MKHRFITLLTALLATGLLLTGCTAWSTEHSTGGQGTTDATAVDTPTTAQTEGDETVTQTEPMTEPVTDEVTLAESATEPETEPEPLEIKNPDIAERYFIYRIWNFRKNSLPDFKRTVDAAAEAGFNAIKIHMPWYLIEREAGSFDFTGFDEMFDYVINEKGMKALCSVDFTRDYADHFFPDEAYMKDYDGKLSVGGAFLPRAQISFCYEAAVEAAVNAYAKTVEHFDGLFGDGILLYLPAFNQYAETEYWAAGSYDYSDIAVTTFRSWLKNKYGNVSALNTALGTEHADFDSVQAPTLNATDSLGVLWYQFRHEKLKSAIDRLSDAQKAVCPDTRMAVQFGCVWDGAAKTRGTLGFAALCEKVDVIWVDDGPNMDHCWSMDYIRSVLPNTVQLAQEIDGPSQNGASPKNYLKQGLESFERGATYVSIANWSINADFETYKPVWREIADTWLVDEHPPILLMTDETPVLKLSLYEVFRRGAVNFAQSARNRLSRDGRFVYIQLTDDLTARPVGEAIQAYSFPGDFSTVQGENGFSYMSYTKQGFVPMTWDKDNKRWQGSAPFSLVMPGGTLHPDSDADTAVVFTAPTDGTVTYSLNAGLGSAESNGVQALVMVNGSKVWPTSGKYQKININTPASAELTLTVRAGDEIAFLLNPYGNNSFDSTAVSIDIVYQ